MVIDIIGLISLLANWKVSVSLPPHIDPHLTISDMKTKPNPQKIIITIKDNHHNFFSKPLKLRIHTLDTDGTSHDEYMEVPPGDIIYDLPPRASGGWWVNVEVEDEDGDKATWPERYIHNGDNDYYSVRPG